MTDDEHDQEMKRIGRDTAKAHLELLMARTEVEKARAARMNRENQPWSGKPTDGE